MSAAALALLLSGCPPTVSQPCDTDADCPDGRCRFGACGPICEEDLDCGSRQVCQQGACVPRPECAQDADCAQGFVCTEGMCRCTSDAACALNQACVSGVCQARERCTSDEMCPSNQKCELTQGLCLPPCASSADCAPGVDPRVAVALYQCFQGGCFRRCVNDVTCGTGFICASGLCEAAQCQTMSDCAQGQYCTSESFGRCAAFETCTTTAECAPNFECRAFDAQSCPPGFPCETTLCQELPTCFVDQDCTGGLPGQSQTAAYCEENHCQPTTACTDASSCALDQTCVAGLCVPGGCRGHADCDIGDACVGGTCRTPPAAIDIAQLAIAPLTSHLAVGDTLQLRLVGYELGGASYPLGAAQFEAVDEMGQPSGAVTVDGSGVVTGVTAGKVLIRAQVPGAAVNPIGATVFVHAALSSGRRVIVIDAASRQPIAGATVRGCDGPPAQGPCPAPLDVTTGPTGEALFPSFAAATSSFSVAAPGLRADGLPQYERASAVEVTASDLLLPLWPNPVQAEAGFNGTIAFNQVHSTGNYWVGFAALSVGDPADLRMQQLLGETFFVSVPGIPQTFPVPGSAVIYTSPGLGIANPVKERSLGLGQPGRRNTTAFAGRTTVEQVLTARSFDLLAYAGALDYALVPFFSFASYPRVPDATDVDRDGLCTDAQLCPTGPESVPDYFRFTPFSSTPRQEQLRRTEVIFPNLPGDFDSAIVAAIEAAPETGLTPLGFTSRAAGPIGAGGDRPVEPVVLRSGAPSGGVEVGEPGLWVMAVQAQSLTTGAGPVSARVTRGPLLPTRAVVPPLLPLAQGSSWSSMAFSPSQPGWNALVSAGGELARLDFVGTQVRHRVYFAASGSQTSVRLPEAAPGAGTDPVSEADATLEVTVIDLRPGVSVPDALDLRGATLADPAMIMDGYSRWQSL